MTTNPTPDIWYKSKRVIRTVIQVVISGIALVVAVQAVAPEVLTELAKVLPGPVIAWLTAAVAFLAALAGVLSRIMAIPQINQLLTKLGAGSVPAGGVKDAIVPGDGLSDPGNDGPKHAA
jgi:hypothetical protein